MGKVSRDKQKHIYFIVLYLVICLLPTIFTLFYQGREFVDLGLLITTILIVIFVLPIRKQILGLTRK
ncbi:hypothetical protein JN09_000714 [Acholeplasma morum]|uniref:hypothetical protein n=1 Tax=Paracholeplasma morum TaxID=264637 RepID=UPI0019563536|nr:hypothetical protein [Paracholeplasma morum]MBM7453388.1 hypothetical protein [Paracholeplasma morum]